VLQPQIGVSYEAGMMWQNQQHQVQINLYDLRLNHEIAFDPTQTVDEPFGSYRNFGLTERRGFSISDMYQWNDKIAFDAQFNYVYPHFLSIYEGKQIPAVPRVTANAGWRYALNDHWRARYNALYTGERYASEDVMNIGKQLPGYWLHAIALQYLYQALEVSFSIDNLFNQTYSAYTLFDSTSNTNTYYPGAGRLYLLTLKWNIE
jgi:iron complex outermembrane receptor protein